MIVKVMCRIAGGQLGPGELEVSQPVAPLVSWSVNTRDDSAEWSSQANDLAVELHLPDDTVWTGEAYLVTDADHESLLPVLLRGTGPLKENSIPLHSDVVAKRLDPMLVERQG
jgi:hypothetical protein